MHAELCPVCKGRSYTVEDHPDTPIREAKCPGCAGKGWVEVADGPAPLLPQSFVPAPYPVYPPQWPGTSTPWWQVWPYYGTWWSGSVGCVAPHTAVFCAP